jgi:hypothetical protein
MAIYSREQGGINLMMHKRRKIKGREKREESETSFLPSFLLPNKTALPLPVEGCLSLLVEGVGGGRCIDACGRTTCGGDGWCC